MCRGALDEMADPTKDNAALKRAIRKPLEKSKKFDDKSKKDLENVVDEIALGVLAALIGMKLGDGAQKRLEEMNSALKKKPKKRCIWCWIAFVLFVVIVVIIAVWYFTNWLDLICFEEWRIAFSCPKPTSAESLEW